MANPVPGYKITTPFRKKGPHWKTGFHVGVDFAAPSGTPVLAYKDGKVVEAKEGVLWGPSYGKAIIVDHGEGIRAIYAHLSKISVKTGDKVTEGQQIGEVGSTGNSTGPHLHLEARTKPWKYNDVLVDPTPFVGAKTALKAKLTQALPDKRQTTGSNPEEPVKKVAKAQPKKP